MHTYIHIRICIKYNILMYVCDLYECNIIHMYAYSVEFTIYSDLCIMFANYCQ